MNHGESEGAVDKAAYMRILNPRIGLTAKGWRDAKVYDGLLWDLGEVTDVCMPAGSGMALRPRAPAPPL